jgi:hypothetical protein
VRSSDPGDEHKNLTSFAVCTSTIESQHGIKTSLHGSFPGLYYTHLLSSAFVKAGLAKDIWMAANNAKVAELQKLIVRAKKEDLIYIYVRNKVLHNVAFHFLTPVCISRSERSHRSHAGGAQTNRSCKHPNRGRR